MEIDPNIATDIVTHLKDALRHEINFFNTDGIIVASTDPTRVGSGHDGARLAIALKQTVCVDDEHPFEGARNGVNVPVQFDGEVVAVIGITGERAEVEPFGTVLQKMTEILIREHLDQLAQSNRRALLTSLVISLMHGSRDETDVERLAAMLDVDLTRPCSAIVIRGDEPDDLLTHREQLAPVLEQEINMPPGAIGTLTSQEYLLIILDGSGTEAALRTASAIQEIISRHTEHPTHCGFGCATPTMLDCRASYEQAVTALQWGIANKASRAPAPRSSRATPLTPTPSSRSTSTMYADLDLGLVLPQIPPAQAQTLVHHVFGDLPDATVDAFETTFDAYTRRNGSINAAAEELFLHKNTLQNHLNRIAATTGYNPRDLNDHTVLALAFLLRRQAGRAR